MEFGKFKKYNLKFQKSSLLKKSLKNMFSQNTKILKILFMIPLEILSSNQQKLQKILNLNLKTNKGK